MDKTTNSIEHERPPLGELELDILSYVSDNKPVSIRNVADGFGVERGLARTTVLTVMERLRVKGFIKRAKTTAAADGGRTGVYLYEPTGDHDNVLSNLVRRFVDRTLDGSLAPFVSYLVDSKGLTEQEAVQLRDLLDR